MNSMTFAQLEKLTMALPIEQRHALGQKLLESVVADDAQNRLAESERQNPLLKWAGVFAGEPDDVSESVKEILFEDVDPEAGFGV